MKDDVSFAVLRISVLSLIQVALFVLFYEAIAELYVRFVGPMNKVFGFGMQLDYSTLLLSILAGTNSLLQVFTNKTWIRLASFGGASILWILYWSTIAEVVPNRFLTLSSLGMVSFFMGALLAYRPSEVELELA